MSGQWYSVYPRCARCNAALFGPRPPMVCPSCGAYLTGATCRQCGRLGGWDFISGLCPTCHANGPGALPVAPPPPPERPKSPVDQAPSEPRSQDRCSRCHTFKKKSEYVCPNCGHKQWGDIAIVGILALPGVATAYLGMTYGTGLVHDAALLAGGIWAVLFVAIALSDALARPHSATAQTGPTSVWSNSSYLQNPVSQSSPSLVRVNEAWDSMVMPSQSAPAAPVRLSPAEIQELIDSLPAALQELVRAAFLPTVEPGDLGPASGFGGVPYLSDGVDHPSCPRCGKPLAQFLQLRLADVPDEVRPLGEGLLQLLYCIESLDGDPCEFALEAFSAFSPAVRIRIVPDGPGAASTAAAVFTPRRIIGWTRQPEPPGWGEDAAELGDEIEEEVLDELSDAGLPASGDKLGGWPAWIQGAQYPQCRLCQQLMKYVFQVDSNDHLDYMFGDVGTGHLFQCQVHPAELAFTWECS